MFENGKVKKTRPDTRSYVAPRWQRSESVTDGWSRFIATKKQTINKSLLFDDNADHHMNGSTEVKTRYKRTKDLKTRITMRCLEV